jgi:hypothetical protein
MGCTSGSEIPRSPEFEDSFRHRSFAGNIFLIKSPRTRDGCATQSEDLGGHRSPLQRKNGVRHRRPSIVGRLCEMAICLQKRKCRNRASLAIRHLVDVSNQTKTELCVTVVSLSLDFFRCRGLNGMFADFSADLAVDLCLTTKWKFESRK